MSCRASITDETPLLEEALRLRDRGLFICREDTQYVAYWDRTTVQMQSLQAVAHYHEAVTDKIKLMNKI